MKITINGSPKELAELLDALGGMENAEKKEELPPLLTELAEDEKINELAAAIRNAGKENAPQVEAAKQEQSLMPFLTKDLGNRGYRTEHKENAPQAEATEQKKNKEIFEKQMELLSKASEFCVADVNLTQCLATLTHAMIELSPFCTRD